jgi:hypothetical protein
LNHCTNGGNGDPLVTMTFYWRSNVDDGTISANVAINEIGDPSMKMAQRAAINGDPLAIP